MSPRVFLSNRIHPPSTPTGIQSRAGFQPPSADGGIGGSTGGEVGEGSPELSRVVRGGTPGEFNLYIFAMSWKAEW